MKKIFFAAVLMPVGVVFAKDNGCILMIGNETVNPYSGDFYSFLAYGLGGLGDNEQSE